MAAPDQAYDIPFIFLDGIGKTEPAKRKLIRKYVMLGKNRGKTRSSKSVNVTMPSHLRDASETPDEPAGVLIKMRYSMIPRKVGSDLSFTQFAAVVEPPFIHDLLKFSFMAKRVMYPLEKHIVFHRKTKVDTSWFELLTSDAAYVHAAVFAYQAYILHTSTQATPMATRRAIAHHSAALRLLQDRLSVSAGDNEISDATVLVVLYLALHAHFMTGYKTAMHHMKGLRRIVDLRGGLTAFSYNTKLVIELLKCDLGIALHNNTSPTFFNDPFIEPLIPYDLAMLTAEEPGLSESELRWKPAQLGISAHLGQAWMFLKRFCSTVNSAAKNNRQLPKETLLKAMASVMYRLIQMNSFDPTSLDEAVRLGLLVFSSHIFLNWQDIRPSHTSLPQIYRSCLLHLRLPSVPSPQLLLWLLICGSFSVFTPEDDTWLIPWVRVNVQLCNAQSWRDLRGHLAAFPWVDILHDEAGRAIFDSAVSPQSSIEPTTWT